MNKVGQVQPVTVGCASWPAPNAVSERGKPVSTAVFLFASPLQLFFRLHTSCPAVLNERPATERSSCCL